MNVTSGQAAAVPLRGCYCYCGWAIVWALTLSAPVPLPAAQTPHAPTSREVEAIFSPLVAPEGPGLAVIVRLNGRTEFKRGYGSRDLRSGARIDAHTNFRLASCTKQFTAMAVMLLVHDGKLRLDNRLTDIFPDFPAYGKAITVRNLLNHTSGLLAYEDLLEKQYAGQSWPDVPQISDAGVLDLMKQQTATKFAPGTSWEYSNSGYCVLAKVIEKVSGAQFADFLRQRIFRPLGMNSTVALEYGQSHVNARAYGYTKNANVWLETDQSTTSATLGDGGVYSSLDDLSKWDDALRQHTLLSERETLPGLTPATSTSAWPKGPGGGPILYGFGWFLNSHAGHPRLWHYGESIGFRTVIERFPSDVLTIVILANRTDLDPAALALKVADLYLH